MKFLALASVVVLTLLSTASAQEALPKAGELFNIPCVGHKMFSEELKKNHGTLVQGTRALDDNTFIFVVRGEDGSILIARESLDENYVCVLGSGLDWMKIIAKGVNL